VREISEETLRHYHQADWHMYSTIDDSKLTLANQYNETDYNHLTGAGRHWACITGTSTNSAAIRS